MSGQPTVEPRRTACLSKHSYLRFLLYRPRGAEITSTSVPAGSLRPTRTSRIAVDAATIGTVEITVADRDRTQPFLLLHGGGGAGTMAGFADLLAERTHSRVLLPTHPGFGGTPRPDSLRSVTDLARTYVALLDRLEL